MILNVYNEPQATGVCLKLRTLHERIEVVAVHPTTGLVINTLLRFNQDGTISMANSIDKQFGFQLTDIHNQVMINKQGY